MHFMIKIFFDILNIQSENPAYGSQISQFLQIVAQISKLDSVAQIIT